MQPGLSERRLNQVLPRTSLRRRRPTQRPSLTAATRWTGTVLWKENKFKTKISKPIITKKKKKIKNERCLKFPVFKVFHTNLRSFTSELNIAAAASTCFSPTVSGAYSWWSRLVLRFSCRQKWITTQEVLLRRSRTRRPSGRQTSGPSFQECVDLMLGVKKKHTPGKNSDETCRENV